MGGKENQKENHMSFFTSFFTSSKIRNEVRASEDKLLLKAEELVLAVIVDQRTRGVNALSGIMGNCNIAVEDLKRLRRDYPTVRV